MDMAISFVNAGATGLVALAILYAVLSPRVHDGIVIKIGLICMAGGFGAIAIRLLDGFAPADAVTFARALLLVNAGVAVVIIGYALRRGKAHHKLRRVADFVATTPEDREP